MHAIINFFVELFAGWRVKEHANDWHYARQKAKNSRAEVEEIIRKHDARLK